MDTGRAAPPVPLAAGDVIQAALAKLRPSTNAIAGHRDEHMLADRRNEIPAVARLARRLRRASAPGRSASSRADACRHRNLQTRGSPGRCARCAARPLAQEGLTATARRGPRGRAALRVAARKPQRTRRGGHPRPGRRRGSPPSPPPAAPQRSIVTHATATSTASSSSGVASARAGIAVAASRARCPRIVALGSIADTHRSRGPWEPAPTPTLITVRAYPNARRICSATR